MKYLYQIYSVMTNEKKLLFRSIHICKKIMSDLLSRPIQFVKYYFKCWPIQLVKYLIILWTNVIDDRPLATEKQKHNNKYISTSLLSLPSNRTQFPGILKRVIQTTTICLTHNIHYEKYC